MNENRSREPREGLTLLAVILGPASVTEVPIDGGLQAAALPLRCSRANIPTLLLILVCHNVVVLNVIQDLRPVQGGQVAEIWVLLDAHGPTRDVHEVGQAHVLQLEHLEEHQGIVEEQVVAADDGEVGEEVAQAFQAIDAEQQQVVCDDGEPWKLKTSEVLGLGLEHQQDLQVALNHRAVLQGLQVGHIVLDVLALTDCRTQEGVTILGNTSVHNFSHHYGTSDTHNILANILSTDVC